LWLVAVAGMSTALRIALLSEVHGPWVFMDELGYQRLAQSLGQSGKLALFGNEGLSYSPLYSAVLAPIYALGASAPTAYHWMRIVNALLMSLSVFPIYKIARFVLPRRPSLLVAALSAFAPLMYYTALVMSENLAYPLFLVSVWAMLIAVRAPSPRADAALLCSVLAASATRVQFIVLFPAALTAVAIAAVLGGERPAGTRARSIPRAFRQHWLLVGSGVLVALLAGIRALASGSVLSVAGRYETVGSHGFPDPWRVLGFAVKHLAVLDLAVGVLPFCAALFAVYAFFQHGSRPDTRTFAAVALATTTWLLLAAGFNSALFSGYHERYVFYVAPFFVVALVAAVRVPQSTTSFRVCVFAACLAGLLPAVLPFGEVINNTIVADSLGLQMFGDKVGATIAPIAHAKLSAISWAALLALTYALVRTRVRMVTLIVVVVFVFMSSLVRARMIGAAAGSTEAGLPEHRDWVDRTRPRGDVILIGGRGARRIALLETAFNNVSIARVYYTCAPVFGEEFGEQRVRIDRTGRLRDASGYVNARYAAVAARFGLRGRVLARNSKGGLVLIASPSGRLSVPADRRPDASCT
jgi:hypothetical protein